MPARIILPELGPGGCSSAGIELGGVAESCQLALTSWQGLCGGKVAVGLILKQEASVQAGFLFGSIAKRF